MSARNSGPMPDGVRRPRFAELFAGGGGLSLGLERAGWECVFHAENAPGPRAILRHRWPNVPLHGDVVALSGGRKMKRWLRAKYAGKIDLLSGGSPCQDLSVAGKRAGLSGARSSLFFRQMRLWKILGADLCLWENVDGARSSNRGQDFAAVLSAFVGGTVPVPADGWSRAGVVRGPAGVAAWRVLDAQFFGVPQRRRRVFVLGTRTGSVDPAEVLSLAEGVRGDSSARREAREGTAAAAGRGTAVPLLEIGKRTGVSTTDVRAGSGIGDDGDPMFTLQASAQHGVVAFDWQNSDSMGMECRSESSDSLRTKSVPAVLAFNVKQDGADAEAIAPTLLAMPHDQSHANGGGQLGVVAFDTTQITHPKNRSNPQLGDPCHPLAAAGHAPVVCLTGDVTHALTHEGYDAGEDGRGTPVVVALDGEGNATENVSGVLQAHHSSHNRGAIVAFNETGHEKWTEERIAGSLNAHEAREAHTILGTLNGSQRQQVDGAMTAQHGIPRRLTPRECERLMDWPDDWTLVPDAKGKPLSDAARYKACGNGVASVHSHWIGWRLWLALGGAP